MTDIQAIATLASTVAAHGDDLQAAIATEREARASLLQAVIDAAKPALRFLASRIKTSDWSTGLGTDSQRDGVEYGAGNGLLVSGDEKPERDAPRDNAGSYEGHGFFLAADGSLLVLEYAGTWSRWQGDSDRWEAEIERVPAEDAVARLVRLNRDDDAITAISEALTRYAAGKAPERAKAARARAEKLRAVAALMKA